MRISDWSSDVCSSDLPPIGMRRDSMSLYHGLAQPVPIRRSAAARASSVISAPESMRAISSRRSPGLRWLTWVATRWPVVRFSTCQWRSEEHTSELQSLIRNSYAVFCLKQKDHEPLSDGTSTPTQH